MTVVSMCSAKGSPGVTTIACAIAAVWPAERGVVVAECDPSGGDLAARFGLSAKRGMTSLMLDARHTSFEPIQIRDHLQTLPGGLEVLVGPTGAGASRTVDSQLSGCLARLLEHRVGDSEVLHDLVLDCGRILPGAPGQVAALAAADHVLVIARPTVDSVASTRWIAERLSRGNPDGVLASLVLVGNGPVPSSEAASTLGLELVSIVPEDRVGSAALRGESVKARRLARSALVSCARSLVLKLLEERAPASSDVFGYEVLGRARS
jgi:cellulose biosynthesis protein BcsQ